MGKLLNSNTGQQIYLKSTHSLGRDPELVDTVLSNPLSSRLQCILRFQGGTWYLSDKSKNGTLLNKQPITADKIAVNVGDVITLPSDEKNAWKVTDTSDPKPVLICNEDEGYIELGTLNLLPSEEDVQLLITRQADSATWLVERGESVRTIRSNDTLFFDHRIWSFYPNDLTMETQTHHIDNETTSALVLHFHVSLNEENVKLVTVFDSKETDMNYKTHHQLLLTLARRLIDDEKNNIPIRDRGWLATDLLLQNLGISANHLNMLIYRSRKAFEMIQLPHPPIDRRQGEIRLRACHIFIQKGDDKSQYQPLV